MNIDCDYLIGKHILDYELFDTGKGVIFKLQNENVYMKIIAPDKGAEHKLLLVAHSLYQNNEDIKYLIANKVRDSATGKILSTEIEGDVQGKNCIIIDDICDGDATFIELAKVLKAKGAADLYLYVTHGIFSKGLLPLKEYFKHIYCYHTFLPDWVLVGDEDYLTILKKGV